MPHSILSDFKNLFISCCAFALLTACQSNTAEQTPKTIGHPTAKIETEKDTLPTLKKAVAEPIDSSKKVEVASQEKVEKSVLQKSVPVENKNTTSVEKKGNVIEFHQKFDQANQKSIIESQPKDLDLSETSGGMLSAYSLYKNDYQIYFHVFEKGEWQVWKELAENKEVQNPKRKVFAPQRLEPSVSKIQFKSSSATDSEVVFRIFTFSK